MKSAELKIGKYTMTLTLNEVKQIIRSLNSEYYKTENEKVGRLVIDIEGLLGYKQ